MMQEADKDENYKIDKVVLSDLIAHSHVIYDAEFMK